MSSSAGASPSRDTSASRKAQPPLPPGDASEQTVDYVQSPIVRKPTIDSLLPPGAEGEPAAPPVGVSELGAFRAPGASFMHPTTATSQSAPAIVTDSKRAVARAISPDEKAQRRFWKNAILFGFFIVVLMAVCYLLAR